MPRKKEVTFQVNTNSRSFDDGTVVTTIKEIARDGENSLVTTKKSIKTDKNKRKKNNEREITGEVVEKKYTYDDGSSLVDVKRFRFTPKNKEKRLEEHTVELISAEAVQEAGAEAVKDNAEG